MNTAAASMAERLMAALDAGQSKGGDVRTGIRVAPGVGRVRHGILKARFAERRGAGAIKGS